MQAISSTPGPLIWITACSHGEEVGGMVVVQEVFKRLRKIPLIRGSLHAFPLLNPLGFEMGTRNITLSQEDLNRSFPGNSRGTLAERIADKVFRLITETKPAAVIDLHNDWIRSVPYTVLDPLQSEIPSVQLECLHQLAQDTGFPVVIEPAPLRKSLSYSLTLSGVTALTIELGESYVVNENFVELGVQSIFNLLRRFEMIPKSEPVFQHPLAASLGGRPLYYSSFPLSSSSGVIRFLAKPGQNVRTGQPVARVYNAFGRIQETMLALKNGLVLGNSDSSVAFPGAPVMAFGTFEP
jgi:predicted deacylase